MTNWKTIIKTLGIATCLICAFLMAFGEPLVGINHTGIATAVGITGLAIITSSNKITSTRRTV